MNEYETETTRKGNKSINKSEHPGTFKRFCSGLNPLWPFCNEIGGTEDEAV